MTQILLYQVDQEVRSFLGQTTLENTNMLSAAHLDEVLNALKAQESDIEVLLVGTSVPDPVKVAQQANSLRRNMSVILLANKAQLDNLRRAVQFAPLIGLNTACAAVEDSEGVADALQKAVSVATHRIKRQAALSVADSQISTRPAPGLQRLYVEHLLHHAPIGLVATDEAGNVLAWNTFATSLTGIYEREVIGTRLPEHFKEPWQSKLCKIIASALAEEAVKTLPVVIELQSRVVEVTASVLRESEAERRVILLIRDITEEWRAKREADEARRLLLETNESLKKARDQAVKANQSKSIFLATMSHELRTPLNAIIGYSEMLQEQASDEQRNDLASDLARINFAGRHLLMLISEILDISKIEAGKMELFVSRFDLSSVIDEVTSTVQPLIEKNRNRLTVDCNGYPVQVMSDETKVRQILYNLLSNAAKFTEDGEIHLSVRREDGTPTDRIKIEVSDTGIGMSRDQVSILFQEFTQVDPSSTRRHGGTGLGLALSKRFLEMMGGNISVSSEAGVGSRFTADLPVVAPGHQDLHGSTNQRFDRKGSSPNLDLVAALSSDDTVLVIDDDPALHHMMSRILNKEGFRMESAFDGKTGIEMARELMPRAIILDVLMPEIDGWTVLTEIKADPKLADIPVIIVSIVDEKNQGFALGASDYLTKPFERSRLLTILRRYQCEVKKCHVLIVEDDPEIRNLLHRLLISSGCDVRMAGNGAEGLRAVEEKIPDVILLDLMMPEIDGFEFLERLRERDEWKGIPVIVTTARELDDFDRQRLVSGVNRVLQKGHYTKDDLLREIQRAVSALNRS